MFDSYLLIKILTPDAGYIGSSYLRRCFLYRPPNHSLFLQPERGTSARHIDSVSEVIVTMRYEVAMVIGSDNSLPLTLSKQREDYINSIFSRSEYIDSFSLIIFRNELK